jgi:hypothetical protein
MAALEAVATMLPWRCDQPGNPIFEMPGPRSATTGAITLSGEYSVAVLA